MATELFETTQTAYNNLFKVIDDKVGITLAAGTYTAGQIVCSNAGANFANTPILLSTVAGYNTQVVAVVLEAIVAGAGDTGIAAKQGKFNRASITIPTTQTEAAVSGILQNKEIILEDWSL